MHFVRREILHQRKALSESIGKYGSYELNVVSDYLDNMELADNNERQANKKLVAEITEILASATFDEDKIIEVLKKSVAALT